MNPYTIIGGLVAIIALTGGGFWYGTGVGKAKQEVADQAQFDAINKKLAEQKAEATVILARADAERVALLEERDQLKTKLETEKAAHDQITDDLRGKYSSLKLQFVAVQGQAGGRGPSGGDSPGPAANPSGVAGPTLVQLPDTLAAALRQLAFDADQLRDEYALCYGYAEKVR